MAKSVKKTIGDFKFTTRISKQHAQVAREESNSEQQVRKLCEFLNSTNESIVEIAGNLVLRDDELKEAKRIIKKKDSDIAIKTKAIVTAKETLLNAKTRIKDLSNMVEERDSINATNTLIIKDKNKNISSLTNELDKYKSDVFQERVKLKGERLRLKSEIDRLDAQIENNQTNADFLNKKIDKYEKNWFVSTFLKD